MMMNVFAVSRMAMRADQQAMLTSLARLGAAESRMVLRVDQSAIGKQAPSRPRMVNPDLSQGTHTGFTAPASTVSDGQSAQLHVRDTISVESLVRHNAGDYMPDEAEIAKVFDFATSSDLVCVDAGAFKLEVLRAVLHHMRRVLFAAPEWPGAIVIVVRDELLEDATALLSGSFYAPPTRTSVKEAANYAYRLQRTATMARIFNWSQSATERVFTFMDRMAQRLMRFMGKDEIDLA
jgi:hypothetical protein